MVTQFLELNKHSIILTYMYVKMSINHVISMISFNLNNIWINTYMHLINDELNLN